MADKDVWMELSGTVLLFVLVWNMSASVDVFALKNQLQNTRAVATGLSLQFIVMPFLGFTVVKVMNLPPEIGLILLVVTSSPGGSFSNWFCSLFNGDLALSVAMTAISSVLSVLTLPLNLLLYANLAYGSSDMFVQWSAIFSALMVVIVAIGTGLVASYKFPTSEFHLATNRVGNAAGLILIIFSFIISNSNPDLRLWEHDSAFYIGVALPCILGLTVATTVSTLLGLPRPERVTVSVECCIQNTGIAVTVALTMFQEDDLAAAMAVPFYYGCVECLTIGLFCLTVWKLGWTKAPPDETLWNMLVTPYAVLELSEDRKTLAAAGEEDDYCYVQHGDAPAATGTEASNVRVGRSALTDAPEYVRTCTI